MPIPAEAEPPSIGGPINPDRTIRIPLEVWSTLRAATHTAPDTWHVRGRDVHLVADETGLARLTPAPSAS